MSCSSVVLPLLSVRARWACWLPRHWRATETGSASHARSWLSGQQFTILSAGMPARRACANAVSAYEELRRCMRIAVEREEAPRFKGAGGQRVIEVLSRRISIDLNRDATLSGRGENTVSPVGDDTGARSGDATARMGENPNRRMGDGGEHRSV